MKELATRFGDPGNLTGVLTEPDSRRPGSPIILLLNAGLLHHVGPHRLNVDLARRGAEAGFASVRFDLSGIGDSPMLNEDLPYVERSMLDIKTVMDEVDRRLGPSTYLPIGLCSGAFNALRIAVEDERVAGCVFLDGYSYPTLKYKAKHYAPRLLDLRRWSSYIQRKLGLSEPPKRSRDMLVFETEIVPKERFHDELQTLVSRDTKMLFVFSGGGPQPFNYQRQLHDAFPDIDFDSTSRVIWYPMADHTYTFPAHRSKLISDIDEWLESTFPKELTK